MKTIQMTVNGREVEREVEDDSLLIRFLRGELGLTGTHEGCDSGHCGACSVLIDGKLAKSCMMLSAALGGAKVTTIEGVANQGSLHPMQKAFNENHGLQCGFCTPGMVIAAIDMVERYKSEGAELTEDAIRSELSGNICRCTGYQNIVASIRQAATQM